MVLKLELSPKKISVSEAVPKVTLAFL